MLSFMNQEIHNDIKNEIHNEIMKYGIMKYIVYDAQNNITNYEIMCTSDNFKIICIKFDETIMKNLNKKRGYILYGCTDVDPNCMTYDALSSINCVFLKIKTGITYSKDVKRLYMIYNEVCICHNDKFKNQVLEKMCTYSNYLEYKKYVKSLSNSGLKNHYNMVFSKNVKNTFLRKGLMKTKLIRHKIDEK